MSGRLLGIVLLGLVAGCGQTAQIDGSVVDHAGAPLAEVDVKVVKSAYAAKTDVNGVYSVPFAPGSFQVSFERDGYTSHVLNLSIQESVVFPAEPVELFPKPADSGLHVLADTGLTALAPAAVETMKVGSGWYTTEKLHCSGEGPVVAGDDLRVVDTTGSILMPSKLADYGLFYRPASSDEPEVNGLFKDTSSTVGQEALKVRSLSLEPGRYAFITFETKRDGKVDIDKDGACYPFQVQ